MKNFKTKNGFFTGNVGIGTTNPLSLLAVQDSTHGGTIQIGSSSGEDKYQYVNFANNWQIGKNNLTASSIGQPGSLYIHNLDRSITDFCITSNGNVGIGATSPNQRLEVSDTTSSTTSTYASIISGATGNAGITFGDAAVKLGGGILYNNSDNALRFFKSGFTEAMRIDSAGNVGIGTTDPFAKLHLQGTNAVNSADVEDQLIFHRGFNSGVIDSRFGALSFGTSGNLGHAGRLDFKLSTPYAQPGSIPTNIGTVATVMSLNGEGNVGIGTTDPGANLHIFGDNSVSGSEGFIKIENDVYGTAGYIGDAHTLMTGGVSNQLAIRGHTAGIVFGVDASPKMFLNGQGSLGVGTNSYASYSLTTGPGSMAYKSDSDGAGSLLLSNDAAKGWSCMYLNKVNWSTNSPDSRQVAFYVNGVQAGTITSNATTTSYNETSDRRLKKNIEDCDSAISKVGAIRVRRFDWKIDDSRQDYGVIAQELISVAPRAVYQSVNEEDMMGVDLSKLVPMLIKCSQEQQQLIESQKQLIESQQSTVDDLISRVESLES